MKENRQCTYKRNTEARSRNHCCSGKANEYYTFWVCLCNHSYPACKAHAPCYIVFCGLSGCHISQHYLI